MALSAQGRLTLDVRVDRFAYRQPFRISGHVFNESILVVAELRDGKWRGRGEAAGVYYLGDDSGHIVAEIERVRGHIEAGATRHDLQALLPPGGARNALDCAFWELEADRSGASVWQLAGLSQPAPLRSTITIGAGDPATMAGAALAIDPKAPIKLKLTGEVALDTARVAAVRRARPASWIGVDANQGYSIETLVELLPAMLDNKVALLEQPLARGAEGDLNGVERPLPFAADESAVTLADTDALPGRFDIVNIKLDKCGGLTEGLAIAARARELGLGVMVGNMMGSSLSMAPAFLLGQQCDVVDLDGPPFLAADRTPGVSYRDGHMYCPPAIWGHPLRHV